MLYDLIRPLLFALPPEPAHKAGLAALRVMPDLSVKDPELKVRAFGLDFPNPIGLAAGFDKYASAVPYWQRLGFGFVELGTFTRLPQEGNAPPRIWRYPGQRALINRFGFNNPGADQAALRLRRLRDAGRWPEIRVGISLGKSKATPLDGAVDDYLYSLAKLKDLADYIAINVSSPNTPGLRGLQHASVLKKIVVAMAKEARQGKKKLPLLAKLAPDLSDKELLASADAALAGGASGIIVSNTSSGRTGMPETAYPEGGLSGAPIGPRADACLALLARHTRGKVPLVGSGGVMSVQDALRKQDLGATLVQVYTGLIYQGPGFPAQICRQIVDNRA
ncbi:MAG: quinone-dependent dihydroorotate dehydrogenase [candidate division FCPU426 bacterium]